ncbi:MAG: hypothetical protein NVS4B1_22720 [Ktedonobacteraceae bacterium]
MNPTAFEGRHHNHTRGQKDGEAVRDDLDTLVMDANVLSELLAGQEPARTKELELKIITRLRKHRDNPEFIALGQRLEELRERHEQGLLVNLAFVKQLLEIARQVVEAEKEVDPIEEQHKGKAVLTELFNEVRTRHTSVLVERVVNDIDEIVRHVRFPGWQQTHAGDREVRQVLRKTLMKYKLHQEQDLFDRAYAYIAQYY